MATNGKEQFFYTPYQETSETFRLVPFADQYNQIFNKFESTGIPDFIHELTGIPFRPIMTGVNFDGRPFFYHQSDVLWEEAFDKAFKSKKWLAINRLPEMSPEQARIERVAVDLIKGLGQPWPLEGVKSAQVEYHRLGLVKVSGMYSEREFVLGRNKMGNAASVKQAIALELKGDVSF